MASRPQVRPSSAAREYRRLQGLLLNVIGAHGAIPDPAARRAAAHMRKQIKTLSYTDVQITKTA